MNRIVREHYPVAKLPEDLREGFGVGDEVRVTVEVLGGEPAPSSTRENGQAKERTGLFSQFRELSVARFSSFEEVNAHVRGLRDEWDDPGR